MHTIDRMEWELKCYTGYHIKVDGTIVECFTGGESRTSLSGEAVSILRCGVSGGEPLKLGLGLRLNICDLNRVRDNIPLPSTFSLMNLLGAFL